MLKERKIIDFITKHITDEEHIIHEQVFDQLEIEDLVYGAMGHNHADYEKYLT